MRRFILVSIAALLTATTPSAAEPPAPDSFEITGHKGPFAFVGFSADSKVLTMVDEGGLVRRWDARTGKLLPSRTDSPLPLEYPHPTAKGAGERLHRGAGRGLVPPRDRRGQDAPRGLGTRSASTSDDCARHGAFPQDSDGSTRRLPPERIPDHDFNPE